MQVAFTLRVMTELELPRGVKLEDLCVQLPPETRIITVRGQEVALVEPYETEAVEEMEAALAV